MFIRRKLIRKLAQDVLSQNNVRSAPVDVFTIAQRSGLEIRRESTREDLSGFLFRNQKENLAVIGVNSQQSSVRQRFTVAHELGHYLLHSDRVHVDKGYEVKRRDEKSKEGTDVAEVEANLFAAELLMPTGMLEQDFALRGSIDLTDEAALRDLANRYKVSTQALAFRLAYLGFS